MPRTRHSRAITLLALMPFGNSANSVSRRDRLRIAQRFSGRAYRQVPKGRLIEPGTREFSIVPSGLGFTGQENPTLKRWATVECPYGTMAARWRPWIFRKALL